MLRTPPTARRTATLAASALLVLATSSCGLGTAGGRVPEASLAGGLEDAPSLEGAQISVGSKNFSENVLLGKMSLILFQAAGAEVEDLTNIPGSAAARQAHLEGDIDAMWEYTGTGWLVYLGHEKPIKGTEEQYDAVRDEDLKANKLDWLPPAPMNNTYAFAITQAGKEKYGISKLSEIAKVPEAERTFCVESEFANRADGLPGMLKTYGLDGKVPGGNIQTYQTGAIYDATAKGECTFGEVFTTDGRIVALDLDVLEDDKAYFPNYNVSLVVRDAVAEKYPEIEEIMGPVTEKLTDDVMLALNAQIDVDGREPEDVALDWLKKEGFVE
ncbi:glycine betaine ABC transporter substrate-binding protein [Nocardioides sp.]|uniref:glycine betaine ABC transporter substrate-binding protein n=1 Tax=Nocardioides sp. TaxID=35761 RepID=UPI0027166283|nr:glycine betaine ABC transporter substrate-binding protein [Nocardioides sp.]MDO9457490.1 glycine betaine ABC transporter substrate-binding protein [Nocardioides sp.]